MSCWRRGAAGPVRWRGSGRPTELHTLLLAGALLFGILLMHGGLTAQIFPAHAGGMDRSAGAAAAKADGVMSAPLTERAAKPSPSRPSPARLAVAPPAETAMVGHLPDVMGAGRMFADQGHDGRGGHVGANCLAVLRSAVLLAGLLVVLLIAVRRRPGSGPRPARCLGRRGPPGSRHPPRAPSLAFLCVLRL